MHLTKHKYSYEYRINILDCTNKNKYNLDTQLLFEEKHIQSLHSDNSSPLPCSVRHRAGAALQTIRTMPARKGMVKYCDGHHHVPVVKLSRARRCQEAAAAGRGADMGCAASAEGPPQVLL